MSTSPNFERRVVGRYELLSLLGAGGAANTYRATDTTTGDSLAVKELRLLKASNSKQIELFERECAILRELDHGQIPTFIDNVVERRPETISLYLVQELVEGRSLQQWLDEGRRFSPAETVAIMHSCLDPLEYLHDRKPPLFHRDIKPSNIIQRPDGSCVLVDFGAVREAILDDRGRGSSVVGTFGYMAPEQFQARAYPATDLYGLAATALHLLTGLEPGRFPLKRLKPEIQQYLRTDAHLTAILDILLEPSPEDRYANVSGLRSALERWTDTHGEDPARLELATVVSPGRSRSGATEPTVAVADDAATPDESLSGEIAPAVAPAVPSQPAEAKSGRKSKGRGGARKNAGKKPATAPAASASEPAEGPSASPGIPAPDHGSTAPRLTVDDLADFARRESLPAPLALKAGQPFTPASPLPAVTDEATAPPIAVAALVSADRGQRQELAHDASGVRVPVVTERALFAEAILPGGLGARELGPALAVLGVGLLLFAWFGSLDYNRSIWLVAGGVLTIYGLLLGLVPRRAPGRSTAAAQEGPRATAEVRRIVKRVGFLGGSEWIVEYSFEADDELHYVSSFCLPSAKVAKDVALDPAKVRVRYASHDPGDSVLVLQK